MSAGEVAVDMVNSLLGTPPEICASCGKEGIDECHARAFLFRETIIELRKCTACDFVKYCSDDECQKNHRQHEKACKKRAADIIRDEKLFRQPDESHLRECQICCLPLPIDMIKSVANSCCCNICDSCDYANKFREWNQGQGYKCAYCREPTPKTDEEIDQDDIKRVNANDPVQMGNKCYDDGDYEGAFEYMTKAAQSGNIEAHYQLGRMYRLGQGVEEDVEKAIYYWEKAAIGGHPRARHNLGRLEWESGRYDRAVKHFIIAVKLGNQNSLSYFKRLNAEGRASIKEDYDAAVRAYRAAKARKKRAAEIRDDKLFTQPDIGWLGECPICCLPLPIDAKKSKLMACCCQTICKGCDYANQLRELKAGLEHRCVFCREPLLSNKNEEVRSLMKRIKKNDPAAMQCMGKKHYRDKGDYETALEYFTKAAALGNASAHFHLSNMYYEGQGVEKDMKKFTYHSEEAAIAGHHMARYNLGCGEWESGRYDRAVKHFVIAANLGDHDATKALKDLYVDGHASKEAYADALRAYQAAVDATKSTQREEAYAFARLKR